jgi:hypothetical protein
MRRIENRDPEAISLWLEVLKTRMETGEPYVMWEDNVNKDNPIAYAMNNLKTNNTANNYYATNGTSGFLIGEIDGPSSANNWNFASIVLCNPQLTLLTNFTSTGTSLDTGGSVNGHSGVALTHWLHLMTQ